MEEWKDINGFDNYQISNHGRVRNKSTLKILKGHISIWGYHWVDVRKNKTRKHLAVHRLVAEHFLQPPTKVQKEWANNTKNKVVLVNHIDSDKTNNHYSNLEWVTSSENGKHAYKYGNATIQRGRAKLSEEQIEQIKKDYSNYNGSIIEFAREVCGKYNVVRKTIRRILYNQTWKD